jgi:hypothetical protein
VPNSQPIPADELHGVLSQAFSDLYKDLHGIRPRWTRYDALSVEKLGEMVLDLQADVEAAVAWEQVKAQEAAKAAAREAAAACPWMDRAAVAGACGW